MSSRPPAWLALPPALVAAVALVASIGLHVPAYMGLGLLKALLDDEAPAQEQTPIEVELIASPAEPRVPEEEEERADPVDEELLDDEPAHPPEALAAAPEPRPTPAEPEAQPAIATPAPAAPPPPSQVEPRRETSVEHRSADPTVEPPPDAQHLAEENSRVEEETMARIRNPNLNDPEPQAPSADGPTPPAEEEGDAPDEEMAELDDAPGSDEREPTPEELVPNPDRPQQASRSRTPSTSEAARGAGRAGGAPEEPARPAEAAGGGRMARGGGAEPIPTREIMVSDGTGSYRMRVPIDARPEGEGEGEGGGIAMAGRGRGSVGEGRSSGRAGRGNRRARGGARRGQGAPNLRISWSDFSSIYGEEELERDRQLYLEQRRSRVAGVSRAERWRRFRAAMENYDVRVRPGNQTALNTRADPFASFIAAMHRRIHVRFAEGYLTRVPSTVDEAFRTNPNMNTKLELAIDGEGRVDHVSIVATSGDILFDLGAYESVMGAQPFPAPPEAIRSPDGLVYLHWSFYRNHRQCGTFNAQPFILASAPAPRRSQDDDEVDRGPTRPGNDFLPGGSREPPSPPSETRREPAAVPRDPTDT